ncbi:MAG: hypothetical protein ACYC6L_05495 [Anaerolineae bacterium]
MPNFDFTVVFDFKAFAVIVALSALLMGMFEAILKPSFVKFRIDTFWLFYVSLVLGTPIGWATRLNMIPLFAGDIAWIGRAITAVLCGLGPKILYDIIEKGNTYRMPESIT